MKLKIPYIQYLLDESSQSWSDWIPAVVTVDDESGKVSSIVISPNAQVLKPPFPTKLRCINLEERITPENVYWLILNDEGLYQTKYNPQQKKAIKATPIGKASDAKAISQFEMPGFDTEEYDAMCEAAKQLHEESQLTPDDLLSLSDIPNADMRLADNVVIQQLIDGDDTADLTHTFKQQSNEAYLNQVSAALQILLTLHDSYKRRKEALYTFLADNWLHIKSTHLSYTALPEHPVTKLMVRIAERLGAFDKKQPIEILMPGLCTESQHDAFPNLDKLPLPMVLNTHVIVSLSQRYLLPVWLLLHDTSLDSASSSLKSLQGLMNPYCAMDDTEHAYLAPEDLERLYYHSELTSQLQDNYKQYKLAATDQSNLLGQLNTLCLMLKAYDAHGGSGTQTNAAAGAYPAIMSFLKYYGQLNPIGLYRSEQALTLDMISEGRNLGYFLVSEGSETGLYCVSQHDKSITLIGHAEKTLRYPVDLLQVEIYQDTQELRARLTQEHPTLIHAKNTNQYFLYGEKADGWEFTPIVTQARIRFPEEINRIVTLALGNVPDVLYDAIERERAHHVQETLMDYLVEAYPGGCDTLTAEQLATIQTHTSYAYLLAFKQVPESIRIQINQLYAFVQNPTKNVSATENLATCIGTIREALMSEVAAHQTILEGIHWNKEQTQGNLQKTVDALCQKRTELIDALQRGTYAGADPLPPTPEILRYLGIPLVIQTPAQLAWLCTFPTGILDAFLSDESNPGPRNYLQEECQSLDDISMLLLEAPARSFGPLLKAIQDQVEIHILNRFKLAGLLSFLSLEKCGALLHAIEERLFHAIKHGYSLTHMLLNLDETRCALVLEVLKERLPTLIPSLEQLQYALNPLNDMQRMLVIEAVKGQLVSMITESDDQNTTSAVKLASILKFLNIDQCKLVLNAVQGKLIGTMEDRSIIQNAKQLKDVLIELNGKQHDVLFEAIKGQLGSIIQNSEQLSTVFQGLHDKQRGIFLEGLKSQLPAIITNIEQLKEILRALNQKPQETLLELLKGQLPTLIKNAEQLRDVLKELMNTTLEETLFELLKSQLPTLIKNAEQLKDILKALDYPQRGMVLKILENHLPEIIQNNNDLDTVLLFCNKKQKYPVLESLKAKLPRMVNVRKLNLSYTAYTFNKDIKAAVEQCPQGFFYTPRAEKINVGSLEGKLNKYIDSRTSEGSFHWDFLYMMTIMNWLCGGLSVKHRDTKINAARYVLSALKDEKEYAVGIASLDELPANQVLEENYKNSYLLIGDKVAHQVLYYVGFEGYAMAVNIKGPEALAAFIAENTHRRLTYDEVSQELSKYATGKLPTDAQLEALKEGLLGDIMAGATGVENIVSGQNLAPDATEAHAPGEG